MWQRAVERKIRTRRRAHKSVGESTVRKSDDIGGERALYIYIKIFTFDKVTNEVPALRSGPNECASPNEMTVISFGPERMCFARTKVLRGQTVCTNARLHGGHQGPGSARAGPGSPCSTCWVWWGQEAED